MTFRSLTAAFVSSCRGISSHLPQMCLTAFTAPTHRRLIAAVSRRGENGWKRNEEERDFTVPGAAAFKKREAVVWSVLLALHSHSSSQLRPLFATFQRRSLAPATAHRTVSIYEGKRNRTGHDRRNREKKSFSLQHTISLRKPWALCQCQLSAAFFLFLHVAAGAADHAGCAHGEESLVLFASISSRRQPERIS